MEGAELQNFPIFSSNFLKKSKFHSISSWGKPCLPNHQVTYLSACLPDCPPTFINVPSSDLLPVCLPVFLSVCLSAWQSTSLSLSFLGSSLFLWVSSFCGLLYFWNRLHHLVIFIFWIVFIYKVFFIFGSYSFFGASSFLGHRHFWGHFHCWGLFYI